MALLTRGSWGAAVVLLAICAVAILSGSVLTRGVAGSNGGASEEILLAANEALQAAGSDHSGKQEDPATLQLLIAVLKDAYAKGLLDDDLSEPLYHWFIDNIIVPDTGETTDEAKRRIALGVDVWEAPFDFLLIVIEEAYGAGSLGDELNEALSQRFIDKLISPNSGETGDQVMERLTDTLAVGSKSISETFGTRVDPVPFRETAVAPNGTAITVLASNLDAADILPDWYKTSEPLDPGNRYVIVRVRVEVDDEQYHVPRQRLGLAAASGRIISADSLNRSGWIPVGDWCSPLDGAFLLETVQTIEVVLCYQAPIEEKGLSIFYGVTEYWWPDRVQGFWAVSRVDQPSITTTEPTAITDTFGTRANPVPVGLKALAPDGVAITVLSANLDATQASAASDGYGYVPPEEGSKSVAVRVRIEDVTGGAYYEDSFRRVSVEDFGIVASSGLIIPGQPHLGCGYNPDRLVDFELFKGGWVEGDMCFEIPAEENRLTLYYESETSTYGELTAGIWDVSTGMIPPTPVEAPTAISDAYGTLANPVPAGEKARVSDGIALTVLGVGPSPEGDMVSLRLRLEYFPDRENALVYVDHHDLGLVRASGEIIELARCEPDSFLWLEVQLVYGGWQESEVCFDVPGEEAGLSLFYLPQWSDLRPQPDNGVPGFWAVSTASTPRPPTEAPRPISAAYGNLAHPVPAGRTALATQDTAMTVTSSIMDAAVWGQSSPDAHKSIVVRVRMEGSGADPDRLRWADIRDFGLAGASGVLSTVTPTQCDTTLVGGWDRRNIDVRFFNGGWQELNLCFDVPDTESDHLSVYYQPEGADHPLGFWAVARPAAAHGIPPVSETFGTLQRPVPLGEQALVSGGLAISVVSADVDANQALEDGQTASYRPPAPGNAYVLVRVSVDNLTGYGGPVAIGERQFGLVTRSGRIVYEVDQFHVYQCGRVPDSLDGELPNEGSREGNLCFQVPVEETEGLVLYYSPNRSRILGFWEVSSGAPPRAPSEPPTPISDSYGTRADPVPAGQRALASDGYAVSVSSVDLDVSVEDISYGSLKPGHKYVGIRVHIENHAAPEDNALFADLRNFGILTSSATSGYGSDPLCPDTYRAIYREVVFRGGFAEGYICYQVPADETELTLFYRPGEETLGFWTVSDAADSGAPTPKPLPRAVSDFYGTLTAPVPLGETALASNSIAIRILGIADHDKILEESDEHFPPPDPGKEYFVLRAYIENLDDDYQDELLTVSHLDFGLITAPPREQILSDWPPECGRRANSPVISVHPFPDQLTEAHLFKDNWIEAYLCFQVPVGETIERVFYKPWDGDWRDHYPTEEWRSKPALGFWTVSKDTPPPRESFLPDPSVLFWDDVRLWY